LLGIVLLSTQINAQLKKGQLVDGIAAGIGNEIVLESDITEQENHAKQMGEKISGDNCEVVESLLNNRLLVYHAKKDTLIPDRSKEIKEQVNNKYNQILSQFPSEKAMLDTYKFRNSTEMKSMIEKIDSDSYYGQSKFARITEKADITPSEVTDFYNTYKYQLPEVKEEITGSAYVRDEDMDDFMKDKRSDKGQLINDTISNLKKLQAVPNRVGSDKDNVPTLKDTDIKKANELVPSLMQVKLTQRGEGGNIDLNFLIGIKAVLHPVTSAEKR